MQNAFKYITPFITSTGLIGMPILAQDMLGLVIYYLVNTVKK